MLLISSVGMLLADVMVAISFVLGDKAPLTIAGEDEFLLKFP